jgi:hypothetical protein
LFGIVSLAEGDVFLDNDVHRGINVDIRIMLGWMERLWLASL